MKETFKSLYVHFPFCETKCHYCDFYSLADSATTFDDKRLFAESLKTECDLIKKSFAIDFETIFMGGGTPSMTDPDLIAETVGALAKGMNPKEWTMEANPSSISKRNLEKLKKIGINRISLGVQSLEDSLLLKLGRVHTKKQAFQALDLIFESGMKNVSCDLICGVPGLTHENLKNAINRLCQFPITHLSIYLLTVPKGNKLAPFLPKDSEQEFQLKLIHDLMVNNGFDHYEISNFCKPGFEAKHNVNAWERGNYLGLGPSAHSYSKSQEKRWKNLSSLSKYSSKLGQNIFPTDWEELLTPEQIRIEKWMLGLRLNRGIPKSWIQSQNQIRFFEQFLQSGFIEDHPTEESRVRLTPNGFPISDTIISQFVNAH